MTQTTITTRRRRTQQVDAAAVEAASAVSPVRRRRTPAIAESKDDSISKSRAEVSSLLAEYARLESEISALGDRKDDILSRTEELMRMTGVGDKPVQQAGYEAKVEDVMSRSSHEITSAEALTAMKQLGFSQEEFLCVVKPQIGELKKYLSEAEILTIGTRVESKKTGTRVVVAAVKKAKAKAR